MSNCHPYHNLKSWVKPEFILPISTKEALVDRLNELLLQKEQVVCNCEISVRQTGCLYKSTGACQNTSYPVITTHPNPPLYAKSCPLSFNITLACPMIECCNAVPWVEWKCCDRKKMFQRDVSSMPPCDATKEVDDPKCKTPCGLETGTQPYPPIRPTVTTRREIKTSIPRTVTTTHYSKKTDPIEITETEPKDSARYPIQTTRGGERKRTEASSTIMYAIIGAVVAAILLLLLLFVVGLIVRNRRKRRDQKRVRIVVGSRGDTQKHRRRTNKHETLPRSKTTTNIGSRNKGRDLGAKPRERKR